MSKLCEVQSRMHPKLSTSIADQQQNVQTMWGTEQNASKCVHCRSATECPNYVRYRGECIQMWTHVLQINAPKGVHKYCRSTTQCPSHVKYRAECIQWCPQVLQINNGMSNPCVVQSGIHLRVSTSIADQQQNVQPMWSTEQNASRSVHKYCRSTTECSTHVRYRAEASKVVHKYCRSTTECPTHVKYRAEYIQGYPQVLQINNRMSNPCEVQSGIHPRMSTSIADQQQNVQPMWSTERNTSNGVHTSIVDQQQNVQPMWSTERNTSKGVHTRIADQQQNVQPMWSTEQNTSKGVHTSIADQQQNVQSMWSTEQNASKDVHKYCGSTTECSIHVKYRAEYIQGFPQVLQINNRMSNPCVVQSRIHPRVSTSIADQQQSVQSMWGIEQNAFKCVHMYYKSTTECPTPVKYRAECIQGCPQVLQINTRMFIPFKVQSRMHPKLSTSI